jgi:hypothetical protein
MNKVINTKSISFSTTKIDILFNDTKLADATGFIYNYSEKYYLVTNWHNVTGKHSTTGVLLDTKNAGVPNKIKIYIRGFKIVKETNTVETRNCIIDLYKDNMPIWYEHQKGSLVDVIAIDLEIKDPEYHIFSVNTDRYNNISAGNRIVAVGYPEKVSGVNHLPIYKGGIIATDINTDIEELPQLYIDILGSPGMSGSPVFACIEGNYIHEGKENKVENMGFAISTVEQFIGCYSGRLGKKNIGAQLGRVWKEEAIVRIINDKIIGSESHKKELSNDYLDRHHDDWDIT